MDELWLIGVAEAGLAVDAADGRLAGAAGVTLGEAEAALAVDAVDCVRV